MLSKHCKNVRRVCGLDEEVIEPGLRALLPGLSIGVPGDRDHQWGLSTQRPNLPTQFEPVEVGIPMSVMNTSGGSAATAAKAAGEPFRIGVPRVGTADSVSPDRPSGTEQEGRDDPANRGLSVAPERICWQG